MIKPSFRSLMMKGADQHCEEGIIIIVITILPQVFTA